MRKYYSWPETHFAHPISLILMNFFRDYKRIKGKKWVSGHKMLKLLPEMKKKKTQEGSS